MKEEEKLKKKRRKILMRDTGRKIGIKEEKKISITNPRHHL